MSVSLMIALIVIIIHWYFGSKGNDKIDCLNCSSFLNIMFSFATLNIDFSVSFANSLYSKGYV